MKGRPVQTALSILVTTGAVVLLCALSRMTLQQPLLDRHCMKSAKAVQISYNITRYGDPFHQYIDFQVKPANVRGQSGTIMGYESPLNAWILAALYLIVDSDDFTVRVDTARYLTLAYVIGAFLLFAIFVLREDLMALVVFFLTFVVSDFTISWSTRPLAETYAVFYQAIFCLGAAHLLGLDVASLKKMLACAGLTFLLCIGGKMNYFLLAAPFVVLFPFLDAGMRGPRPKLAYFACILGVGALAAGALYVFTDFSFKGTLIFFLKGNKEILHDSLWLTFIEGFDSFEEVRVRTREHFGAVVYYGGLLGTAYVAVRSVYLVISQRWRRLTFYQTFQVVLFSLLLGHALNYIVLRNLYIPHHYYVFPLHMLFCLALALMISDLLRFSRAPFAGNPRVRDRLDRAERRALAMLSFQRREDAAPLSALWAVGASFLAVSLAAAYVAWALASYEDYRVYYVSAAKIFGSRALGVDLNRDIDRFIRVLRSVRAPALGIALAAYAALLVACLASVPGGRVDRWLRPVSDFLRRVRVTGVHVAALLLVAILGAHIVVYNSHLNFEREKSLTMFVNIARRLDRIREETPPGEIVLCRRLCWAFYADKRVILEPKVRDYAFYRANDIHFLCEPPKPFQEFYEPVPRYPEPESYWRLGPEPATEGPAS